MHGWLTWAKDHGYSVRDEAKRDFPKLNWQTFEEKSEATFKYNCIAFAVCDESQPWWPNRDDHYWPSEEEGIRTKETVAAFIAAYGTKRYFACGKDDSLEVGFEKIAIYANPERKNPHMQRVNDPMEDGGVNGGGIDIWHDSLAEVDGTIVRGSSLLLKAGKRIHRK